MVRRWVLAPTEAVRWADLLPTDSDPFVRALHAALDSGELVAVQDDLGHVRLIDADGEEVR